HARDDELAQQIVGHADRLREFHAGALNEDAVDLDWGDIRTACLDDVTEAAFPVQMTFIIDIAAIASAKEALIVERFVQGYADVTKHQRRALDGDLAAFAHRCDLTGK